MDILITVFALLCTLTCGFSVYACYRHASDAHDVANDLRTSRARLIAAEAAAVSLEAKDERLLSRLKSLEGRFYQERTREPPSTSVAPLKPACENWMQAQLDGPRSEAASCECDYCSEQRAQRNREKAAILALHQRGAPRRNGGE